MLIFAVPRNQAYVSQLREQRHDKMVISYIFLTLQQNPFKDIFDSRVVFGLYISMINVLYTNIMYTNIMYANIKVSNIHYICIHNVCMLK